MLFNSFEFLWLFPIIFCVYYLMAWKKFGNCVLLLISYGLYIKWEPVYALILLWVTAITYVTARLFNSRTFVKDSSRKLLFIVGILLTVAPLCLFKYYHFPSDKDYKVLKDLCVKYDVPFINHYADARLCNNSDFFADVAHLNQGGAEKFTSMIASEIKGVLKK